MFSIPHSLHTYILTGQYSWPIVALSILIAILSAYTALTMNQRMRNPGFFHKRLWLVLASFAMGLGIWSMHFIGMSAFMLPVKMQYSLSVTILSALPAIAAAYLAFYIANKNQATNRNYIFAGVIMGLGIASMHYLGMMAMKIEAHYYFKPALFFISIIVAVVVSFIALYIFTILQRYMGNYYVKTITAIIMGIAVSSMHYTGMASVVFYTYRPLTGHTETNLMDMSLLITIVSIGISTLLILSILATLLDKYVDYRQYYFDSLTLLPNQRQFERDMAKRSENGSLAVIHLHHLSRWNKELGYTIGDKIIEQVAKVIERNNANDTSKIYRVDGHRFAVFCPDKLNQNHLKKMMTEALAVLRQPLIIFHHQIDIQMVCAIADTSDGQAISKLYSNCVAVLNHPDVGYHHQLIQYDATIHDNSFANELNRRLEQAIRQNEIYLVYQPKVNTNTHDVSGLEALVRWHHPIYGLISPGKFIPILEKSGQIIPLTNWIIAMVCEKIALLCKEGIPFKQISINIPGLYVTSPDLLAVLQQEIAKNKITSAFIELEITETSVIENIDEAIMAVNRFRKLGIAVALDDFGTGLSSLSNLNRLPITTVKIDKSFIDGISTSGKDLALLKAIIDLCTTLKLKMVIEGVETLEQVNVIDTLGEHLQIQGFYFSKPLTTRRLKSWLLQ